MVTATDVTFLTVAIYLLDLGIKIVALGLVPEGRRPSSATAWLLLILFLPIIGLLAFWLIGSPFVDRGRRRQQAAAGEVISNALTAEPTISCPSPPGPRSILSWSSMAAGVAALCWRQQGRPLQRLQRVDRGDGTPGPHRRTIRARRGLHHELGRYDR